MRGPGEGQVTLIPKATWTTTEANMGKGKGKEVDRSGPVQPMNRLVADDELDQVAAWNQVVHMEGLRVPSQIASERDGVDASRPVISLNDEDEITPRILDVVRIPDSQLRFFPKPRKPPDATPRHSLENEVRRGSLDRTAKSNNQPSSTDGPSIQNNLRNLPRPLQPMKPLPTPTPPKSAKIVRLRPPSIPRPSGSPNNLANRLSSLFMVPPPSPISLPTSRSQPRLSMESTRSSNVSSPARPTVKQPEVVLEMHPRNSVDPAKVNGGWVPVSEGRKSR